VETGTCDKVHGIWIYAVTSTAPGATKLTIEAEATDRPQHSGRLSVDHIL
jgi:hypothetical protein